MMKVVVQTRGMAPLQRLSTDGNNALCYTYEKLFGEKVRALGERARPRDLYDVKNLFWHTEFRPRTSEVLDVLREKRAFKSIPLPGHF